MFKSVPPYRLRYNFIESEFRVMNFISWRCPLNGGLLHFDNFFATLTTVSHLFIRHLLGAITPFRTLNPLTPISGVYARLIMRFHYYIKQTSGSKIVRNQIKTEHLRWTHGCCTEIPVTFSSVRTRNTKIVSVARTRKYTSS